MCNLIGVVGVNIMKLGVKSAVNNYVTWVISKNMCKLLSIVFSRVMGFARNIIDLDS